MMWRRIRRCFPPLGMSLEPAHADDVELAYIYLNLNFTSTPYSRGLPSSLSVNSGGASSARLMYFHPSDCDSATRTIVENALSTR